MSKVDPRVETILSKPRAGQSLRTRLKTDLKAQKGQRNIQRLRARDRHEVIRTYYENDYLKLVEEWIDDLPDLPPPPPPPPGGDGDWPGGDDEGPSVDGNGPGGKGGNKRRPLDPTNIPNIEDEKKKLKEILDDKKNSEKSQAEKDKETEREKLKEKGFNDAEIDENDEILDQIDEPRREMQKFWRSLIGKSIEYRKVIVQNQQRGEPSPESIMDNYPDFLNAQQTGNFDSANIYEDQEFEKVEINQPERIEVSLLVDVSGSMYYDRKNYKNGRGDKTTDAGWIAKQAEALLLYSLDDFNRELKVARSNGDIDSQLEADTQVLLYDDGFTIAKDFKNGNTLQDEKADIIGAITSTWGGGGTCDDEPLGWIQNRISSSDKERMSSKKLKKIVFEITDGATADPDSSRVIVENLSEDGVLMIGFYIGYSDWERDQFNSVWNADDSDVTIKGIDIENDLSQLPAKLMEQLAGALGDITI
jgi:hypothetical protein